ncbi:hypothetical protein BGZ54_000506 [Gamsiella multidivaricata]|nr:hypothetical protein BGZ54_000506 [Gamsiella multidivaricata]
MAQAPRQRHHRHHRGAPAQRRVDAEEPTRQCPSSREPRETTSQSTGNNLPEAPQDMASLREDLGRILEQTKDLESDKIKNVDDTQQFSQVSGTMDVTATETFSRARNPRRSSMMAYFNHGSRPSLTTQAAQKKLVVACQALSARSSEDVDILSKVVFALFNQDLVKPLPPEGSNRHIIDILCGFFLAALRYEELQECKDKETKKSNVNINNLLTETFERARIDILRALSAVLFEKGAYVKDSLQDLFQMIVAVGGNTRSHEYELRRMALNCMANLVHKTGTLFSSFHERMYEVLLSNLTAISQLEPSSISGPLSTARRKDRGSERKVDNTCGYAL